ncbi:protease modulator HflC [Sedimentisphaera salicampi]|uniref:Protein HflC n=1 Tax=Sedimentisphaera salicampi TaxID=1941349 RepID=A0A1W6LKT0_9BACT|nr:protease modulator HflC [Sedimentisphaera salicampi]ARN56353.1 Modulator of FtsH protease HflC [Sedimentisphaera salicampi]OXU15236.1 Modulator of FtsH protease HflC [Sedimentisphaera salicampi]
MNPTKIANYILWGFIALFVAFNLFCYTVKETEQAVITQFGKYKRVEKDAGLKFKIPFVEKVNMFEKRLLEWDGTPTQMPTVEKRYINVDTFGRWRIVDPLEFMKTLRTETAAQSRLDDIINSAVRNRISSNQLIEAVRNSNREMSMMVEVKDIREQDVSNISMGRNAIENKILAEAKISAKDFGIELVDVLIKRINYTEQVREKVYERMVEERLRVAAEYRSEGEGEKMNIQGKIENDTNRIISEAYRESQQIRGSADSEAVKIYAESYGLDPDFFAFYKTLESYKENLKGSNAVLSTDSEYLKYLSSSTGRQMQETAE